MLEFSLILQNPFEQNIGNFAAKLKHEFGQYFLNKKQKVFTLECLHAINLTLTYDTNTHNNFLLCSYRKSVILCIFKKKHMVMFITESYCVESGSVVYVKV